MLRAIAVWNRAPFVMVPLVLASLGQWGILLHGIMTIKGTWNEAANACVSGTFPLVFIELKYPYSESSAHYFHCMGRNNKLNI
jgi:hypothetical protein